MMNQLLGQSHLRENPGLPLLPGGPADLSLMRGRVHEVCGRARRTLAVLAMAQMEGGPVLWIAPAWVPERPMPAGLQAFADPGRLIFGAARRPEDILWAMEEGLRAGVVPLVIAEVLALPTLTQMRRLQLATEAGAQAMRRAAPPLGLLLTPGDGGAAGAESRWRMTPAPGGGWRLDRPRARAALPATWMLARGPEGGRPEGGSEGGPKGITAARMAEA